METTPSKQPPIPPASFSFLISTLAAQAMMALGKTPNPVTNQAEVNSELAKHFIDTLAVLEDKTKGNLSPEESAMLEAVLHELRLLFVAVKK